MSSELAEIQAALVDLQGLVGPKAWIDFSIKPNDMNACLYPEGLTSRTGGLAERIGANNGDWREMIASLHAQYLERREQRDENLTRDMALAIVRITFEAGGCSDAQLRAGFDAADVVRLGQTACERANAMADKGPFVLTVLSGANDAEVA